jgi:uncharacterized phage-associated protein
MPKDIVFNFDTVKTTQAAAFLLKQHGKTTMNYLGLIKLLYLSDRRALETVGYPITGDSFVAINCGMVLGNVYNYLQKSAKTYTHWHRYIARIGATSIELIEDPGDSELSTRDEEIMTSVYQEFGHLNPFSVAEWTHLLPEWIDPSTLGEDVNEASVNVIDLLRHLHKSAGEIQLLKEITERERYLDQCFR